MKEKAKKLISIILTAAILQLGSVPFTISAAEVDSLIYEDNFDNYNDNIENALDTGNWKKNSDENWNIIISDGSIKIADSSAGLLRYELPEILSDAKVKVEASVKADLGAVSLFELVPDSGDSGLYAFRIDSNSDGSVMHAQYGWSDAGINSWLYTGTVSEWYNATVIIDIEAQTYDLTVKDSSGSIVAEKNGMQTVMQGRDGNLPNLKYIQFRNWGSAAAYVDNFKISTVETVETPSVDLSSGITENFDSYGSIDDLNSYFRDSWYVEGGRPALVTEGDNKYLSVALGQGIEWCFDTKIADSGKVKVKASVKAESGSAGLIEMLPQDDAYSRLGLYAMQFRGGAFGVQKSWDAPQIASGIAGEWYDIEYTLNFDTGTYGAQIFKDGKVFAQKRGLSMTMEGHSNAILPDLYAIRFRNWDSGAMYVDNLSVEYVTEITDRDDLIFEENFENVDVDQMDVYGWTTNDDTADVQQLDEEHGNSFKITGNSGELLKYFPEITQGKYKFKYSLYTEGDWAIADAFSSDYSGSILGLALFSGGGKFYCSDIGEYAESYLCTTAASTDWVTVENIIDMDEKTVTYTVKDIEGKTCSKTIEKIVNAIDKTTVITELDAFRIRNWRENGAVYVDDVEFMYYNPAPELGSNSVSMSDSFGNLIGNITSGVNPAVGNIILDFGSEVGPESALSAITLTDDTGTTVDFNVESDLGKIILVFSEALKEKTAYKLEVADTLIGLNGKKIKSGFDFEFETGDGTVMSRFANVTSGGKKAESIDDLSAGDTLVVDADFINTKSEPSSLALIVSYFSNDVCVKTESIEINNIPSGTSGIDEKSFIVADMQGVTEVKLFLWDGLKSMLPYDAAYIIKSSE